MVAQDECNATKIIMIERGHFYFLKIVILIIVMVTVQAKAEYKAVF